MNSPRFLILAQMARDILAILISTVASESAFSTWWTCSDSFRSSLTPLMVEALVCIQNWLRKSNDAINLEDYVDELQTIKDVNDQDPLDSDRIISYKDTLIGREFGDYQQSLMNGLEDMDEEDDDNFSQELDQLIDEKGVTSPSLSKNEKRHI
ncbi:hypothetical protein J1N35_028743 [Gossypium stocksii]|uniref:HAT C-terminal dimerisation domain-containing protein n=1 Tax=Gossypium stocksii TaxID=47602 RepID=A0A9D3ZRE8_9ROSI|nr:hypothetical protein J1N35_028743 [Gossypium stocksii]